MNYEEDIRIDETALDVEWLEQASLAMRYGKHWARCKMALTLAEEKIKVVRAELIKLANEDPDKYLGEGTKATAPNIEAFYRMHKRHKEAKQEWIDAQFELNIAEIAKNEISFTRKAALENLVVLHGQQYFAGPRIPRDLSEQREHFQKKTDNKVAQAMNKRKRTT